MGAGLQRYPPLSPIRRKTDTEGHGLADSETVKHTEQCHAQVDEAKQRVGSRKERVTRSLGRGRSVDGVLISMVRGLLRMEVPVNLRKYVCNQEAAINAPEDDHQYRFHIERHACPRPATLLQLGL